MIYVIPFKVNNLQVANRVQVNLARDYCKEKSLEFSLPVSECWQKIDYSELIHSVDKVEKHIIIYSHLMLCTNEFNLLLDTNKKLNEIEYHCTFSKMLLNADNLREEITERQRFIRYSLAYDAMVNRIKGLSHERQRN